MTRSSLSALVVLSLGSIIFYAWLLHAVAGMSITQVAGMSVMVVVVLAVVTYRHIREHGIEPHVRPPNSARVVKIGTCMLIAAALVWTGIYFRAQEHYGAGMIAALCGAGVAVYGIRNR